VGENEPASAAAAAWKEGGRLAAEAACATSCLKNPLHHFSFHYFLSLSFLSLSSLTYFSGSMKSI
jgi:hypothetical protein